VRTAQVRLLLITLLLSSASASRAQWERHGPFVQYPSIKCFAKSEHKLFCGGLFQNYNPTPPQWDSHSIYYSADNGITWIVSDSGITKQDIVERLVVHGKTLFAGSSLHIYRSTDDGASWTPLSHPGRPFVLSNDTSLYATLSIFSSQTSTLLKSTDDGANWWIMGSVPGAEVDAVIRHDGYLFAGGEKGIYRSSDEGANWTACNTGLPKDMYSPTRGIQTLVSNGTTLFAGTWGYGLFASEDDGNNWTLRNLLSGYVTTMVMHGSDIYASDDGPKGGGVFHSSDNGIHWANEGLMSFGIKVLFVFGDFLFAGTSNNNLFRASLSYLTEVEASPSEVPAEFGLEQNYPNPFNPTTRIKYTVGGTGGSGLGTREAGSGVSGLGTSKTSLIVYDLLGREVAVLVNEAKAQGTYEVRFDATTLPSGAYFYRLTAGGKVRTRTMMLIK
jgi:hypothetical protein